MSENENKQETGSLIVSPMEDVLHNSMLPYAEYVILDRALPRVEDGLKPVQRRILYTMSEMGLTPDKPHKKSARIVGDCMGKYHPHGDSSVYDAMVRMAQDYNMGRTLVNGHGNFGSIDGDPPAAMRYTEARLEPLALELLRDMDKDTIPWGLNFDDSLKEPQLLPGRFPNLLVNGASGIAVGLATNIPPHNLSEVIDGVVAYIDKPSIKFEEMLKYIPAPDFPTGGYIIANELIEAYKTGRGKITLRAKMHVEAENDKKLLVITELPYQVNKATMLRKIADMRNAKDSKKDAILENIIDICDESDRTGMRAVIKLKGDTDIHKMIAFLCKYSDLQVTFGINMVAIANGKPQQLGLMDIIKYYVEYQREVILRRTKFDLAQAKERCHILEGLIIAVSNIDEVIAIIKKAESTADAKEKLRKRFDLSERQAQAILDLRLARLTKLEVYKLQEELKSLKELIEKLSAIVASKTLQLKVVRDEILEIKKKYKGERRSILVQSEEEIDLKRMDQKAPGVACYIACSQDKKVKCITEKNFNMSAKAITDKTTNNTLLKVTLPTLTDKTILAFTQKGMCYKIEACKAQCRYVEKGFSLKELNDDAKKDEYPVAFFEIEEGADLLFLTKKGMMKRSARSEYAVQKNSFQAIRLNEGDEVLSVSAYIADEAETIFYVTKQGYCLNAQMNDIPAQGRISAGVKGIMLREGDEVAFCEQINGEGEIILASKSGKFKRVISSQIDSSPRYRKGTIIMPVKGDDYVLFAEYVTQPYYLAVQNEENNFIPLSSEDVFIEIQSGKGRAIKECKEIQMVYAVKYLKVEE